MMALIVTLLALIVVFMSIIVYLLVKQRGSNQKQASRSRRARRSSTETESSFPDQDDSRGSVDPLEKENPNKESKVFKKIKFFSKPNVEHDDADTVLGLNSAPEQLLPTSPTLTPTAAQETPFEPHCLDDVQAPVLTLTLIAPVDRPYSGYELLQGLLSTGFRYGKHNIFHRYESKKSSGTILFSLTSMVAPGSFDLATMGGFSTPGLMIFLDTQKASDPQAVFKQMLHTVDELIDDLGGEVGDAHRHPFTKETLQMMYRQIDHYMQSRHTDDLFADTLN